MPTVGVEFYLKRAVLPGSRNVSLKMWDVGGSVMAQGLNSIELHQTRQ